MNENIGTEAIKAFIRIKPHAKLNSSQKVFSKAAKDKVTSLKNNEVFDFGKNIFLK